MVFKPLQTICFFKILNGRLFKTYFAKGGIVVKQKNVSKELGTGTQLSVGREVGSPFSRYRT